MAGIKVTGFRGGNTAINPRLLGDGDAVTASGVVLDERGSVRQLHSPGAAVTTGFGVGSTISNADSKTIFPYVVSSTRYWLEWLGDVNVAPGPVKDDTYQRLYYTGDGAPKMTYNTLFDDSTGKYPRAYRPLGIPAPVAAPSVSATLPETVVAGSITALTCSTLMMSHDASGDGRNSGNGQTLFYAYSAPTALITFTVGQRFTVASIVDANTVTITGVGDISYACKVKEQDYQLQWNNTDDLWRTRIKSKWNFRIPSGASVTITNHGLSVGDVLQITAVAEQMHFEIATVSTPTFTTSPNNNQYKRTCTKTVTGDFAFTGDCSFLIDRDGTTVDPTVPQQNYTAESRAYVYTYVSALGEEGPPSPASAIVDVVVGDPVTVGGFSTPAVDGREITHKRIYRTNTGSETTEFQFVAELPIATTSYSDTLEPEDLGEVLPSETWYVPPATLSGMVMLPNGSACGFYGKTLCLSEPGYPHAWPTEYQYTVDYDIVGIQVWGQSVLIATKGTPYVATGAHPRAVSVRRITDLAYACISKRSVASTPWGVVYASTDGLVFVNEAGVRNISERFITPTQWKTLVGVGSASAYSILCTWHESTLYMFLRNDTTPADVGVYAFRFDGTQWDYVVLGTASVGTPRYATATYVDPTNGQFYFVDGTVLYSKYEDQTLQTNTYAGKWTSKVFTFGQPINLAYGIVKFRAPALAGTDCYGTLKVKYLDSAGNSITSAETTATFVDTRGATAIRKHDVFRLANAVQADSIQFELSVTGPVVVEGLALGERIEELTDGQA